MSAVVSIQKNLGEFSAAHQLPYHSSKCRNLHGHNYGLTVAISGEILPTVVGDSSSGMVWDFGDLKDIYKQHIEPLLDHCLILGTEPLPWYEAMLRTRVLSLPGGVLADNVGDGSIIDFVETGKITGQLLEFVQRQVDREIGRVTHLPIPVTTVEHLVVWIYDQFRKYLPEHITIDWVHLSETANSYAQYDGSGPTILADEGTIVRLEGSRE